MKKSFTLFAGVLAACLIYSFPASSQATYTFKNAVLESGTSLQPGAVYKFPNVKPGTDARITILGSTGNVSLTAIDENWTGFDEAFQPFINVGPLANGYVEFQLNFYVTGTWTLQNQGAIPVSCIDVDGVTYSDGVLYEHDQVQFLPGYYDYKLTGGNLSVLSLSGWISIKNISGFSYDGIDTTAKDVMATVLNRSTSGFKLRIGAINTSPTKSEVRYRSVYFQRFNYGHQEPLAQKTILQLSGTQKTGGNQLSIMLGQGHSFDRMLIERASSSAAPFLLVGDMDIAGKNETTGPLVFCDGRTEPRTNYYYRVRLVNTQNGKEELSNILLIKDAAGAGQVRLLNTVVQAANPMLALQSVRNGDLRLTITDLSGRVFLKKTVKLNTGTNNIYLPAFPAGLSLALVIIESEGERMGNRVLVQ